MNKLRKVNVVDIETTGLLDEISSPEDFHVLSVCYYDSSEEEYKVISTKNTKDVDKLLSDPSNTIIGHNFYLFDVPAIKKTLGIHTEATIIDTLFLSWYLEPIRLKEGKKHGLQSYGEDFGVPKPEIEDWKGLTYKEYKHRCEEDVKINTNLWHQFLDKLELLYNEDEDQIESIINFLMCKAQVYQMHLNNPLRLDKKNAKKFLGILEGLQAEREEELAKSMPKLPVISKKSKPKVMYKKDGSTSKAGEDWLKLLYNNDLPDTYDGVVEYVRRYDEPSPTSVKQIKDWLFSLGWKPEIFVDAWSKVTEKFKKVPQVKDKEKNLCPSVLKLAEKEPSILQYEDLGIISHRAGYLKGFLKNCDSDGNIVADIAGLTNTLRIRHRTLVNLPAPSSNYGEYVRSVILPPKGHIMIGADLSGLENTTRNNFVIGLDPEFVELQNHRYYDPHLEIGVIAGMMTEDDSNFYKYWKAWKKDNNVIPQDIEYNWSWLNVDEDSSEKLFHSLDKTRHNAKTTNYSAMYGVGAMKLSKELGIAKLEAQKLLDAYWKKNWSIRAFAKRCKVKNIGTQMWVQNPLNGFWYSLRSEKDIFSTVNQGAGDYIFTLWEKFLMDDGVIIRAGFHDEVVVTCPPEKEKETIQKLYTAINKVNEVLQLEVPVGISYEVGINYSEVH